MALADLRTFLHQLDAAGELKAIHGAHRNLEIGVITELSLQHDGPALLFDEIPGFPPTNRVAANVCSTLRRSLMVLGLDPELSREEAIATMRQRVQDYKPVPPVVIDGGPVLENVRTGADVDLTQFPVPMWHELDGGPYIGTGHAVIQQDPETKVVNVGTYRGQLHSRNATGIFFTLPTKDGSVILRKYWAQGKPCPVAVSYGPEPLLFLSGCSSNGIPPGTPEYEYTGYLAGEPVPVIRGHLTGLPIPANSEIAIEGEIPPPDQESRDEGPFGEWTGYYWGIATKEPVIRVKALYYRSDPILYGAPPLKHPNGYAFGLRLQGLRSGMLSHFQRLELPVRSVSGIGPLGTTVITVHQERPDDVQRIMAELDKLSSNNRLILLVDDDVDPSDPYEVLWAVGTRFDPEQARISVVPSAWNLDPTMTLEQRTGEQPVPYKRLVINGCRPFERLKDFPPVNVFSADRRRAAWERWGMTEWLGRPKSKM